MALILGSSGNNTLTGTANDDAILGFAGTDTLNGGQGNDGISGGTGRDVIDGQAGNDAIDGGSGNDTLNGSNGNDVIIGAEGNDTLNGGNGNDELSGGDGNDLLSGLNDQDDLDGGNGNDTLQGGAGNDDLQGLIGDDIVRGGSGVDSLSGGAANAGDADRFVFDDGDTGTGANRDVIVDFNDSAFSGEDLIDLEAVDANVTAGFAGDQDFTFITGAFNAVGQVRVIVDASNVNNRIVEFSNDADAAADGQILLAGIGAANITAADFDL